MYLSSVTDARNVRIFLNCFRRIFLVYCVSKCKLANLCHCRPCYKGDVSMYSTSKWIPSRIALISSENNSHIDDAAYNMFSVVGDDSTID